MSVLKYALLFCIAASAVLADTIYVSPNGDGSNPLQSTGGSFATGYNSIPTAVTAANDGDTVLLDKGTFLGDDTKIEIKKAITLTGVGTPEETVYDGNNKDGKFVITAAGALLKNLTFTRIGSSYAASLGLEMTGNSIVSNIIARQNGNAHSGNARYVFTLSRGLLTSSIITNNYAPRNAGIKLSGSATVENCLIRDNKNKLNNADYGILNVSGGTIRNCTIVDNIANFGTLYVSGKVNLYNNIIMNNVTLADGLPANYYLNGEYSTENWIGNCIAPIEGLTGANNISDDPRIGEDGFHFLESSPCNGTAVKEHATAYDLFGNERGDKPSRGCVEYADMGWLSCLLSASVPSTIVPETITISSVFEGKYTEPLVYDWDVDGDEVFEIEGGDASLVLSQIGRYAPTVRITEGGGKTVTAKLETPVIIYDPNLTAYVTNSVNPNAKAPYVSWETATSDLEDAIKVCANNGKVVLSEGLHELNGKTYSLTKPITITSKSGKDKTFIKSINSVDKLFSVEHKDALIESLTITNSSFNNYDVGAGIMLMAGTVKDIVITDSSMWGHGLITSEATSKDVKILNCSLRNIKADGQGPPGFKLMGSNPRLEGCEVINARTKVDNWQYPGSALFIATDSAKVINCTFVTNGCFIGSPVMTTFQNFIMENCIMMNNYTNLINSADSSAIEIVTDPFRYYEETVDGVKGWRAAPFTPSNLRNSCIYPSTLNYTGYEKIVTDNPLFKGENDYSLTSSSPCVGMGNNENVTLLTDIIGNRRIKGKRVDFGAYELQITPATFILLR